MALTKFNFNSFDLTTAASKGLAFNSSANGFETSSAGSMTLIKTLTASNSSSIDFVHGSSDVVLDNTYPVYLLKVINSHPSSDDVELNVNFRDGGSNYDATKTSSCFSASLYENNQAYYLQYDNGHDLAQSTGNQPIVTNTGKGSVSDNSTSGELFLFNPSSTTFVKHYMVKTNFMGNDGANAYTENAYTAGYCNVTAAIDGVRFLYSSGNIDSGTFKLYGIKDS